VYDPDTGTLTPVNALADGDYSIAYTLTDAAGNEGPKSDPFILTVDTAVPEQSATVTSVTPIPGPMMFMLMSSVSHTNSSSQRVQGELTLDLERGEYVEVLRNGEVIGTAIVEGASWSFDDYNLPDGEFGYAARVFDAAGNKGTVSETYGVAVDTI